jgi:hypothetical protein
MDVLIRPRRLGEKLMGRLSSIDRGDGRVVSPRRQVVWLTLALTCGLLLASRTHAQVTGGVPDISGLTDVERRESTLRWLDAFLTETSLLRPEDMAQIREAVAGMSTSQLEQWLAQTKTLREYVEGEAWQRTKTWLREFLRVQNVYGEDELQRLRDQLVNAEADQMLAILKQIQARHDRLAWMHNAAEQKREFAVRGRDFSVAEQQAANRAARAAAPLELPPVGDTTAAAPGINRVPRGTVIPSPLINSRDVARMAVWSEIWGGGWFFGF